MTEPAGARPFLTRRRVIGGAVVLVVGLSGWALSGVPFYRVQAEFIRFEQPEYGKTSFVVLRMSNRSQDVFYRTFYNPPSIEASFRSVPSAHAVTEMAVESSSGVLTTSLTGKHSSIVYAHPVQTNWFALPDDGRKGNVVVSYLVRRHQPPRFLRPLLARLGWLPKSDLKVRQAVCAQMIQCPSVRPDGTMEPARVLAKREQR